MTEPWREKAAEDKRLKKELRKLCEEHLGADRKHDVRIVLYPREKRDDG